MTTRFPYCRDICELNFGSWSSERSPLRFDLKANTEPADLGADLLRVSKQESNIEEYFHLQGQLAQVE